MLNFLPPLLLGVIASALLLLNILFWVPILWVLALIKLVLPLRAVRKQLDILILPLAECWIACNLSLIHI